MCGGNSECNNSIIKVNKKLVLGLGITHLICFVAIMICGILEVIWKFPSGGAVFGMVFPLLQPAIYAIITYVCAKYRTVYTLFLVCCIQGSITALFFFGQIARIIYIVGFMSHTQDITVDEPTKTAIVLYTELSFFYLATLCCAMSGMLAGLATIGGHQVVDGEEMKKETA